MKKITSVVVTCRTCGDEVVHKSETPAAASHWAADHHPIDHEVEFSYETEAVP